MIYRKKCAISVFSARECKSCRSREMLKSAPALAIGGFDTAKNEPIQSDCNCIECRR